MLLKESECISVCEAKDKSQRTRVVKFGNQQQMGSAMNYGRWSMDGRDGWLWSPNRVYEQQADRQSVSYIYDSGHGLLRENNLNFQQSLLLSSFQY